MSHEKSSENRNPIRSWLFLTAFNACLFVLATAIFSKLYYGSISSAVAYCNGMYLEVDSASKSFGRVRAGEMAHVNFAIRNLSNRPVTLIGVNKDCNCLLMDSLPMTLPPRGSSKLTFGIQTSEI